MKKVLLASVLVWWFGIWGADSKYQFGPFYTDTECNKIREEAVKAYRSHFSGLISSCWQGPGRGKV